MNSNRILKPKSLVEDIVELFQDFLDKRNIEIPNLEKINLLSDQNEDDVHPTTIYGEDYDDILENVKRILSKYQIDTKDESNPLELSDYFYYPKLAKFINGNATSIYTNGAKLIPLKLTTMINSESYIWVVDEFIDDSYLDGILVSPLAWSDNLNTLVNEDNDE
jgi:hypothetical protein